MSSSTQGFVVVADAEQRRTAPGCFLKSEKDAECEQLLKSLVHPLEPLDFLERHWRAQQPVAVVGFEPSRFDQLVDGHLFGGDVAQLGDATSSPQISCWFRSAASSDDGAATTSKKRAAPGDEQWRTIDSVRVEDGAAAAVLHRQGAALYFRASDAMSQLYLRPLNRQLGMNFAGVDHTAQCDHDSSSDDDDDAEKAQKQHICKKPALGEIEVFLSPKGHVTTYHTDFQSNITLQLRGTKRWRLKAGPVVHPLRGCTPHYAETAAVTELQARAHDVCSDEAYARRPEAAFFDDAQVVELTAGSVLFHPPGWWHQVESLDDALSINFSMLATSWGDWISDSLRHALHRLPRFRAPIDVPLLPHGGDAQPSLKRAKRQLRRLLAEAAAVFAAALDANSLLPAALLDDTPAVVDVSTFAAEAPAAEAFDVNPFGALVPLDDNKCRWSLTFFTASNADFAPAARLVLAAPVRHYPAMIADVRARIQRDPATGVASLQRARLAPTKKPGKLNRVLNCLLHYGYLNKPTRSHQPTPPSTTSANPVPKSDTRPPKRQRARTEKPSM